MKVVQEWTKRGSQCLMVAPQLWTSLTRQALNRRLVLAQQLGDTAKEVVQYWEDTLITVAESSLSMSGKVVKKLSRFL